MFFQHEDTKGIIVIGEIGGTAEFDAAEIIVEYMESTKNPKPIIGMVAGRTAPKGKIMGHAGALLAPGEQGAAAKASALEAAGAFVVPHPGVMGYEMKRLLSI
jgi:succinyl-CoA synthetase alpha subunit